MEEILLNVESKEVRAAKLRNGLLAELTLERKNERQLTGNIYRGRVTNILHNIQSAFIDINEGDNGFIHISDILENTKKFEAMFDMDFDSTPDARAAKTKKEENIDIEQVLKMDQSVIVQVVKEPIGKKGARLTSNLSIPGRYLVLLPNSPHRGVSRKIEDRATRDRLKKLIRAFEMPQKMGLICRTASKMASPEMLIQEAHELLSTWEQIQRDFNNTTGSGLLYEESDLIKRCVIEAIDKNYERIMVDDYNTYQRCKRIVDKYVGDQQIRLELYRDRLPMFERFNVEREIQKSMRRKIWLTSGGYLYFDRTEAMLTIDVNSGRSSGGTTDVEETLVRVNMEAAEEIVRQLRIRNIGGLIIIDFIDMRSRKNQRRVMDMLKAAMKDDSAKCTILGMSEFGLVEMTRQRQRGSLSQTMFTECPYCFGSGQIKTHESVAVDIERALKKAINYHEQFALKVRVHPEVNRFLDHHREKDFFKELVEQQNAKVEFEVDDELHLNDFELYSTINNSRLEI
jgi:ribonuclease G